MSNAQNVFEPGDAALLGKARTLLAKAEAGLKGAQSAPKPTPTPTNPDAAGNRQRRLDQLLAGAQACHRQNWADCRQKLTTALDGGARAFLPADKPLLDKARALLDKAETALATVKPRDTTSDARNNALAAPKARVPHHRDDAHDPAAGCAKAPERGGGATRRLLATRGGDLPVQGKAVRPAAATVHG